MMDAVAWSWIGHRCWERGWRSVGDRKESCRSCGGIWSRVVPDAVAEARIGRKTAILVENSSRISSAMLPRGTFTCGGRGCFAFVQPSLDPKCRFVGRAWFALVAGRIWHCCQIWSDRNTHTQREREREREGLQKYTYMFIYISRNPQKIAISIYCAWWRVAKRSILKHRFPRLIPIDLFDHCYYFFLRFGWADWMIPTSFSWLNHLKRQHWKRKICWQNWAIF